MDALEAILSRRSVPKVSASRPDRAVIEKLLEAAVRAPNHHLTEPWRFVVLADKALEQLGEAMAERVRERFAGEPELASKVELERSRPHRAPVIITAIYVPSSNPKALEHEDRYSVGAAMQNILIAAHALGLGGYLRTGPAAEYEGVKRHLGLADGEEIGGFIYVGWPEEESAEPASRRSDHREKTEWRGWD